MRFNLHRKTQKGGISERFVKDAVRLYAEEYDFSSASSAAAYISTGKQGLQSFVDFLQALGYKATAYHLEPNRELFTDVGEEWTRVSRNSPSFGFIIPDDDPWFVEYKLKNG